MPGLKLDPEVHDHAEQDYGDNDRAPDRITQHYRNGAGREKNQDEGIGKEAQKTDECSETGLSHQAVGAMETQSLLRVGGSQSRWSGCEQPQQVLQGHFPKAV